MLLMLMRRGLAPSEDTSGGRRAPLSLPPGELSTPPGLAPNVHKARAVFEGKELCVVEAMKMQNVLHATRDGVVKEVLADAGSVLKADQPIITFEE